MPTMAMQSSEMASVVVVQAHILEIWKDTLEATMGCWLHASATLQGAPGFLTCSGGGAGEM